MQRYATNLIRRGIMHLEASGMTGHTESVKAAVTIPDDLFAWADRAAKERGETRSKFYARALERLLAEETPGEDPVTASWNAVAAEEADDGPDPFLHEAARRLFAMIDADERAAGFAPLGLRSSPSASLPT